MNSNITTILLLVGAFIAGFFVSNNLFPEIKEVTVTETIVDSTVVDSLKQVIEYMEDIPKPDTIKIKVPVPEPVVEEDLNRYEFNLSDEILSAWANALVDGTIEEFDFKYVVKRRMVRENILQIDQIVYRTRTINTTRTIQQRGDLLIGGIASIDLLAPTVTYITSSGTYFSGGYDLINNYPVIGIGTSLKNLNPLKLLQ